MRARANGYGARDDDAARRVGGVDARAMWVLFHRLRWVHGARDRHAIGMDD